MSQPRSHSLAEAVANVAVGDRIFRYVPHRLRAKYEAIGWEVSELGPPHCFYSVLCEWVGECPPVEPMEASGDNT